MHATPRMLWRQPWAAPPAQIGARQGPEAEHATAGLIPMAGNSGTRGNGLEGRILERPDFAAQMGGAHEDRPVVLPGVHRKEHHESHCSKSCS